MRSTKKEISIYDEDKHKYRYKTEIKIVGPAFENTDPTVGTRTAAAGEAPSRPLCRSLVTRHHLFHIVTHTNTVMKVILSVATPSGSYPF